MKECIDSILNQSYQNYEIICIDDASTDNSGKILLNYKEKFPNVKIFSNKSNQGPSVSRNIGIKNATGKYIMFVDGDDLIAQNSLSELYYIAETEQTDILYFNMINFYENIDGIKRSYEKTPIYSEHKGLYSGRELFGLHMSECQMNDQVVRKFIRKAFLDNNRINFYEGILHEDVLFSFFCAMKAKRVMEVNKEYYIRRIREGSITHTKDYKRAQSLFVVIMQVLAYWNKYNFSLKEHQALECYFRIIYKDYQRYSLWFEKEKKELEVGGYVEKAVYSVLYGKHKSSRITLSRVQLITISQSKNIVVFGAGAGCMDILDILKAENIKVDVIAVSDVRQNPEQIYGIKVDSIDNIANYIKEGIVILGVTEKYSLEIQKKLKQLGYHNIIVPEKVREIYDE